LEVNILVTIGNDWDDLLKDEFEKPYYKELRSFLINEYKNNEIYPKMEDIFNALKYTSCKDTKIVIIGQDPYINPGEAHGLSFSVQPGIKIPPSLYNIFKELHDDLGYDIPDNGYLVPWAKQGVLLLNSILTVRRGKSNSHANHGWEVFTDAILNILNKHYALVFMLWGKYAQQKARLIDHQNHVILKAVHPSPLAGGGFSGCKHFSRANQYLYETQPTTIDWQIPNIRKDD
jgi:uracil-DNA glycosylase